MLELLKQGFRTELDNNIDNTVQGKGNGNGDRASYEERNPDQVNRARTFCA